CARRGIKTASEYLTKLQKRLDCQHSSNRRIWGLLSVSQRRKLKPSLNEPSTQPQSSTARSLSKRRLTLARSKSVSWATMNLSPACPAKLFPEKIFIAIPTSTLLMPRNWRFRPNCQKNLQQKFRNWL